MRTALAVAGGTVMAAGLALGGMTRPEKVVGFLDFTGRWDPTLLAVMAGAVTVYAIAHRIARRRIRALDGGPPRRIDGPLLVGAAVFGIGWGMSGVCPGPAVMAAATGGTSWLVFAAAMVAGMALHEGWARRRNGRERR